MEEGLDFLLAEVQIDQGLHGGGAGIPTSKVQIDQGLRGGGAGLPALSVTNRSRYSSIFFVKAPFIIKSRITKT